MREPAYTLIGVLLLVGGFPTRLTGYVVQFADDAYLILAALAVAGVARRRWRRPCAINAEAQAF